MTLGGDSAAAAVPPGLDAAPGGEPPPPAPEGPAADASLGSWWLAAAWGLLALAGGGGALAAQLGSTGRARLTGPTVCGLVGLLATARVARQAWWLYCDQEATKAQMASLTAQMQQLALSGAMGMPGGGFPGGGPPDEVMHGWADVGAPPPGIPQVPGATMAGPATGPIGPPAGQATHAPAGASSLDALGAWAGIAAPVATGAGAAAATGSPPRVPQHRPPELDSKVRQQAKQVKELLTALANARGQDYMWGRRFWSNIYAMDSSGQLVPEVKRFLTGFGYVGEQTVTAPRHEELGAALDRLASEAALTAGAGIWQSTPSQGLAAAAGAQWVPRVRDDLHPSLQQVISAQPGQEAFFPITLVDRPTQMTSRSSRLRHRFKRKLALWALANEFVQGINSMDTGSCTDLTRPRRKESLSENMRGLHGQVHRVALREAKRLAEARRDCGLTGVPAVLELARVEEVGYGRPTRLSTHEALRAEDIDEPQVVKSVNMLEALEPEEARYYSDEGLVVAPTELRSRVIFEELQAKFGFVGGTQEEYEKYFSRPDMPPNLWHFGGPQEVKAIAGFSTVGKKTSGRQRKIIMMVAANYMFQDVRGRAEHGLHGGGALASLHVPSDDWAAAAFDESNAFSFVEVPSWMWGWLCVPPVRASAIWWRLSPSQRDFLNPESWVYPTWRRLVMGSSRSVHILMSINSRICSMTLRRSLVDSQQDHTLAWQAGYQMQKDDDWAERQRLRRDGPPPPSGFSVASWCEAVRHARRQETRVFVVMHLFAGARREQDVQHYVEAMMTDLELKVLMISVDLAEDSRWDLGRVDAFELLWSLVSEGLVDVILGGPPCSTWGRARFRPGGPRPLRRRGKYAWGLPRERLRPSEVERLDEGNRLMVNHLALCGGVGDRGGAWALERPDDPGEGPHPSIFDAEILKDLESRTGARHIIFDQCMMGGPSQKPTRVTGTARLAATEALRCDGAHTHELSYGKVNGNFRTTKLATYPPRLCKWIAEGIVATLSEMAQTGGGPTGHVRDGVKCQRITRYSGPLDLGAFHFLNETSSRGRGAVLGARDTSFYLHIDDGLIAADGGSQQSGEKKVNKLVHQVADALEDVGFVVKDRREHGMVDRIVGYEVESSPARVRVPKRKAALMYEALLLLTSRDWVHLDHLASVIGVWIWAALLARHWLSAPQHLFQFARQEGPRWTRWWPSARREAVAMRRGIMGLYTDLGAPLLPMVFASDAEGAQDFDAGGCGVVVAAANSKIVDRGAVERWYPP
ncbi:unnamed protein product, partial [Prorocentrum cordatum]